MHSFITASIVATAFAASALAQSSPGLDGIFHHTVIPTINCGPDILVDDFHVYNRSMLPIQGEKDPRQVNLLGGDYGTDGTLKFNVSVANKDVEVTPVSGASYFFFKFDAGACFDLSGFNSLSFDIIAPVGGSFDIGLTQKSADCHERLGGETSQYDSKYLPLTQFVTPDGTTKQTVVVPFYSLAGPTQAGPAFDFVHLKDVTFINWKSFNSVYKISNIRLRRACGENGPSGANHTISGAAPTGPTTSSTAPAPGATATAGNGGSPPASSGSAGAAGGSGSNSTSSASSLQVFGAGLVTMMIGSLVAL
ncbi:uncharacterized protein EV422DRAFT_535323 [Fimicolochytrium jonesii]|uniref:uncharacterized protein n=1 Tax=Fimicolochytrium jonesii TaxID=1396493 RepID=UPI0022FE9FA0|nr:uncharacterized protein EV422DRAFT_535323 [Fimicolochytrium jonesii]KAI8819157.1 hypothetical protein EV422DRAFT_535323 [Fimicolochytrium jonesii]